MSNVCKACKGKGYLTYGPPRVMCGDCAGSGTADGSFGIYDKYGRPTRCPLCVGKGVRHFLGPLHRGVHQVGEVPCDHFFEGDKNCIKCKGDGYFQYQSVDANGKATNFTIRCDCVKPPAPQKAIPYPVVPKLTPTAEEEKKRKERLKKAEPCGECSGSGFVPGDNDFDKPCEACDGTGIVFPHERKPLVDPADRPATSRKGRKSRFTRKTT